MTRRSQNGSGLLMRPYDGVRRVVDEQVTEGR